MNVSESETARVDFRRGNQWYPLILFIRDGDIRQHATNSGDTGCGNVSEAGEVSGCLGELLKDDQLT